MKNSQAELRAQSIKDLLKTIKTNEQKLVKLSFDLALGKTNTIKDIRKTRKAVAQTHTIINEKLRTLKSQSNVTKT